MSDKELYQQKKQAQLDEWRADIDKLKARASKASAEAQLDMNRQIETVEKKIDESAARLSELARAGEDAWESIKDGVEEAWDSLKFAVNDAGSKFKALGPV